MNYAIGAPVEKEVRCAISNSLGFGGHNASASEKIRRSGVNMELENLLKLIQAVSDSDLTGFKYEADGVSLNLRKEKEIVTAAPTMMAGQSGMSVGTAQMAAVTTGMDGTGVVTAGTGMVPGVSADAGLKNAEQSGQQPEGYLVKSPLVGTFYAAPAEDAEPYVAVGDQVKKGQIVAIVEAMKLMNDIDCDFDGTVAEILVENGEMVEYGQPLFRIV